jgi:F0F1-type ATP synthase membrane subunit b/b'
MSNTIITVVIAMAVIYTTTSIFSVDPLLNIISAAVQNSGF